MTLHSLWSLPTGKACKGGCLFKKHRHETGSNNIPQDRGVEKQLDLPRLVRLMGQQLKPKRLTQNKSIIMGQIQPGFILASTEGLDSALEKRGLNGVILIAVSA